MNKCESCGMPMVKLSDFGGSKKDNRYCSHCSYADGNLKPKYEIRESMVLYYMKAKRFERKRSEEFVDELMAGQPAWQ